MNGTGQQGQQSLPPSHPETFVQNNKKQMNNDNLPQQFCTEL